jgi:hypothetical protein
MTQYAILEQKTWQQQAGLRTMLLWSSDTEGEFHIDPVPVVGHSIAHLYSPLLTEMADTWYLSPVSFDLGELTDDPVKHWEIEQDDIPEGEPYIIKKPIPVTVERQHESDFTAAFDAGNVSISGQTFQDAFQFLMLEILDTLDTLLSCQASLGSNAKRQLSVLSEYLAKTDSATR